MEKRFTLKLGFEDYYNDDIILCAQSLNEYFDLGDVEEIDLIVATKKPKGNDYYQVTLRPADEDYWHLADDECLCGDTSPWTHKFDCFLSNQFPKVKTLYGWVEA